MLKREHANARSVPSCAQSGTPKIFDFSEKAQIHVYNSTSNTSLFLQVNDLKQKGFDISDLAAIPDSKWGMLCAVPDGITAFSKCPQLKAFVDALATKCGTSGNGGNGNDDDEAGAGRDDKDGKGGSGGHGVRPDAGAGGDGKGKGGSGGDGGQHGGGDGRDGKDGKTGSGGSGGQAGAGRDDKDGKNGSGGLLVGTDPCLLAPKVVRQKF